jgi:cyanate permease
VVGFIRDATHSMTMALLVLSGASIVSSLTALYVARKRPVGGDIARN